MRPKTIRSHPLSQNHNSTKDLENFNALSPSVTSNNFFNAHNLTVVMDPWIMDLPHSSKPRNVVNICTVKFGVKNDPRTQMQCFNGLLFVIKNQTKTTP